MQEKVHLEQEAFIALQNSEEKGLDFFFNRYYSPLVFYSLSFTNNHEVAKEIASEAFVKLWTNRQTITEWRKVKFLLYRIVHNASIDYIREQQSRIQRVEKLQHHSNISESTVLEKLIETETNHLLYLLLSHLPLRCRQVFQMFYFQDKAIKDIALELGISVNTVKSQKQRAIQLLKEKEALLYSSIFLLLKMLF